MGSRPVSHVMARGGQEKDSEASDDRENADNRSSRNEIPADDIAEEDEHGAGEEVEKREHQQHCRAGVAASLV